MYICIHVLDYDLLLPSLSRHHHPILIPTPHATPMDRTAGAAATIAGADIVPLQVEACQGTCF